MFGKKQITEEEALQCLGDMNIRPLKEIYNIEELQYYKALEPTNDIYAVTKILEEKVEEALSCYNLWKYFHLKITFSEYWEGVTSSIKSYVIFSLKSRESNIPDLKLYKEIQNFAHDIDNILK